MGDMNKKTLPIFGDDIKSKIGGGVPVGTMAYWPGTAATLAAIEDDWIIANGATLNKSLYPELFKSIGYTYGGSGDNFLIPYMVDKKYVRCNSSAGSVVSASIPNITGKLISDDGGYNYTPYATGYKGENKQTHCHGALYVDATGVPSNTQGINGANTDRADGWLMFDASRCSTVYNNDATTVTPYSMDMIPIIKVK